LSAAADPMDLLARRSLDQIASAAATLLDARVVLISVFEGPRQIFVGSHGLATVHAAEPSSLCRDVAAAGRPIVLQDARRRLPARTGSVWGFDLAGYAGVPMSLRDPDRAGAFAAITSVPRAWQSQDLRVLHALSAAAAAVLDMRAGCDELVNGERRGAADRFELAAATSKRQTLELEQTSVHDELTGLLNRRGLFASGPAQLDIVRRHSIGGALLYVDLDGLKATNDRYGHAAGDDLLRSAASVLRSSFRDTDTIARVGGDEFVVIATDIPRTEHAEILTRLATELGHANRRRDRRVPLAWSLGLVAIEPATADNLDALMSAADRRMYSAKRERHDRVARAPVS
jgi:diguanylate cyclase (GGDEF)-like protein